jgi:hypothetical protein
MSQNVNRKIMVKEEQIREEYNENKNIYKDLENQ